MRLWVKVLAIIVAAFAVTGFAATIRRIRIDKQRVSEFSRSATNVRADAANAARVGTQPDAHIVRLLSPEDPQFDSTLDSAYPGLRVLASFEALKPNVRLIRNESGQEVHAFVIKWTVQSDGGAPTMIYSPYMNSAGRDRLVTQGAVLASNEVRLLSPSFSFVKSQSPDVLTAQVRANLSSAAQNRVLNCSLDGVIFLDGAFVGPDEAKLVDHFECERSGQHDEGYSMTLAIRKQSSDNEIIAKLNEHIQKGWASRVGTDRESLYYVARGNEAQLLLQLLKQAGRAKFEQAVTALAKMQRTQLWKV